MDACYLTGTSLYTFANQTVTSNKTVTHACDINVQNITVTSNSKLKLNTVGGITINGVFEIGVGSELEIK